MIKELLKVENVVDVLVVQDVAGLEMNGYFLCWDRDLREVGRHMPEEKAMLHVFGQELYALGEEQPLTFGLGGIRIADNLAKGISYPIANGLFIHSENLDDSKKLCRIYRGRDLLWEREFISTTVFVVDGDLLFINFLKGDILERYDAETGRLMWSLDFRELGRYTDDEGVHDGYFVQSFGFHAYKEVLLVPLYQDLLLGVNRHTGEVLWQTETMWSRLVLHEGRVIRFNERRLMEVDILTGRVVRDVDHLRYLKEENGLKSISRFLIARELIYFSDCRRMQVGVMDYHTLELLELYSIRRSKLGWQVGNLQLLGSKLLLMEHLEGFTLNLHVLEDDRLLEQ